jgi:hypothetical protein
MPGIKPSNIDEPLRVPAVSTPEGLTGDHQRPTLRSRQTIANTTRRIDGDKARFRPTAPPRFGDMSHHRLGQEATPRALALSTNRRRIRPRQFPPNTCSPKPVVDTLPQYAAQMLLPSVPSLRPRVLLRRDGAATRRARPMTTTSAFIAPLLDRPSNILEPSRSW